MLPAFRPRIRVFAFAAALALPAPVRDTDHVFLRSMIDHQEALIQMVSAAAGRCTPSVLEDAQKLQSKHRDEQQRLIAYVEKAYGDVVKPWVADHHRATNDSLNTLAPADRDRAFYSAAIAHLREGIRLIDGTMPEFMNADVKKVASGLKASLQREVSDLQRKLKAK